MDDNKLTKVAEVENMLLDLPMKYLMCRDLRHSWHIGEDFKVYDDKLEGPGDVMLVSRSLVCQRCGTERVTVYKTGGWRLERLRTFYRYAGGYQLKHVPEGVRASDYVVDVQFKKVFEK